MKRYKIFALLPVLLTLGCSQGPAENFKEYQLRADHDDPTAENNLAVMYNQGVTVDGEVVVEKNCVKAMGLWRKAIEKGSAIAKNNYDEVVKNHTCPEFSHTIDEGAETSNEAGKGSASHGY